MESHGAQRLAEWWARPLFVIDGVEFCGIDVTLGAMTSGEWPSFERDLAECLACLSEASKRGQPPSSADLDEAGTAFRYDHELISAEDLQSWLDQSNLSVSDWMQYLEWQVARQSCNATMDEVLDAASPSSADLIQAALVFGVCSEQFRRLEDALARRVALVPDLGVCLDPSALAAFDGAAGRLVHTYAHWLGVCARDAHSAAMRALALQSAADAEAKRLLTGSALTAAIERYRLEWQVIETERVVFASEAEAKEALLCIADEGLSLSEVAQLSKRGIDRRVQFMEELAEADADRLMSVGPGTVIGPLAHDDGVALVAVSARSWPSLEDPRVHQRACQAIVTTASLTAIRARLISTPIARK